eukprot:scaffold4880_cov173-Skeletonema_dohrnii-CCMP3373.AAC.1
MASSSPHLKSIILLAPCLRCLAWLGSYTLRKPVTVGKAASKETDLTLFSPWPLAWDTLVLLPRSRSKPHHSRYFRHV